MFILRTIIFWKDQHLLRAYNFNHFHLLVIISLMLEMGVWWEAGGKHSCVLCVCSTHSSHTKKPVLHTGTCWKRKTLELPREHNYLKLMEMEMVNYRPLTDTNLFKKWLSWVWTWMLRKNFRFAIFLTNTKLGELCTPSKQKIRDSRDRSLWTFLIWCCLHFSKELPQTLGYFDFVFQLFG